MTLVAFALFGPFMALVTAVFSLFVPFTRYLSWLALGLAISAAAADLWALASLSQPRPALSIVSPSGPRRDLRVALGVTIVGSLVAMASLRRSRLAR